MLGTAEREKREASSKVALFPRQSSTWTRRDEIVFSATFARTRGWGARAPSPRSRSDAGVDRYTRLGNARAATATGSHAAERRRDAPFRSTAATTFTRAARIGATFAARLLATRAVGATRATAEVAETQDMVCVLVILR